MEKEPRKRKATVEYSEKFKSEAVQEVLSTGDSVSEVAKRLGIGMATLYRWMRIFGIDQPKNYYGRVMDKSKEELLNELAALKREVSRLKKAVWEAEVDAIAQKALVDHLAKKYHIDVKKKDRFRAIDSLKSSTHMNKRLDIKRLCQLLEVSRKGYYKYDREAVEGDEGIKASTVLHYCQYLRQELPKAGVSILQTLCNEYFDGVFSIGRDWLYGLLDANGMLLRSRKKSRPPRTTYGVINHGFQDHLNTIPKYVAPDHCRLTVSDITYVKCREGFVYLSLTMDAYSRIITGYDLQRSLTTEGPLNALKQTISFYREHGFDVKGLIFHSDRGSQYISKKMTEYEASQGIITSVTQTGDPLHNAMAERINGTIKNDWLYQYDTLDFQELKQAVAQSIVLYNTARPHRALGMKVPMQTLLPDYPNPLVKKKTVVA